MTKFDAVKNTIFAKSDMDYVGICPSCVLEQEPEGHRPSELLRGAKSIIVYGRRHISGALQAKFRFFEDHNRSAMGSYSAHASVLSVNHLCMKETYDIAQYLENTYGCMAMPLTNNVLQAVQPEGNYAPFFADPYKAGLPIDIYKAAVAAGIGEMGWNHRVITPDAGPRVYLCAIVTDLEFEQYDTPYAGERLCDPSKCHVCAEVCPTCALSKDTGAKWEVCGRAYEVGALDVNSCSVACFGFKKGMNARSKVIMDTDHPTDEELAAALKKQFANPGIQNLDHLPMFCCDKCMVYCPVGNWSAQFRDKHLTKMGAE